MKHLLYPARTDHRNRTCAALAAPLLTLELMGLFIVSSLPHPFTAETEAGGRIIWMFLYVVPTVLLFVGLRGLRSARKRKLASLVLVLLNLLLLGIVVQMYVSMAHGY